jgi:hypothetical protein
VECWNRLPESVKTAENEVFFKRRLKKKTRVTVHVDDRGMEVSTYAMQLTRTK